MITKGNYQKRNSKKRQTMQWPNEKDKQYNGQMKKDKQYNGQMKKTNNTMAK